jgi:hypothetical protein
MKPLLYIVFGISAALSLIFGVIGWQALAEEMLPAYPFCKSVVIPIAFSLGTIILPFYISPPAQLQEWLKKKT